MHRVRDGLPPYGPPAIPFPEEWGQLGREGLVVEFETSRGDRWTGNFRPGIGRFHEAILHPDQRRSVVFAGGDAWTVDPETQSAVRIAVAIDACWVLARGLLLSRQDLAFLLIGPTGVEWHTRRLSWDGFDQIRISGESLKGLAWCPVDDSWSPFSVDLRSGRADGGSFGDRDTEGWEQLAEPPPG